MLYNFTLLLLPGEQTLITNPSLGGTTIKQTLITHTQGLFVRNIIEFCLEE